MLIDADNYAHNLKFIRDQADQGVKVMAVVKANAYGHGIGQIARLASENADFIGVVSVGEARKVREAGVKTECLILNYLDNESIAAAVELNVALTAMDGEFVAAVQNEAKLQNKTVNIHIKVDTGMHRAGCEPEDLVALAKQVVDAPNLRLQGVFTHFAESESEDRSYTLEQIEIFNGCIEDLKTNGLDVELFHAANSAAIFAFPEAHFSMVRPGLSTYGLNPFDKGHEMYEKVQDGLKFAMRVVSKVAFVRDLKVRDSVGYNRTWRAERPSKVALVPVGYGDGYRRSPFNAGYMLIGGQKAPIVGTVAMDQTVVDVTDIEGITVGDEVVLVGAQGELRITADDIAVNYKDINYEVITSFSERIERVVE